MTDFTHGQSDRNELAEAISDRSEYEGFPPAEEIADYLWSAGWRKKPSREELRKVYILAYAQAPREKVTIPAQLCPDDYDGSTLEATSINMEPILDAILALLDGPTETGETRNE